jgi:adenylate cyclase
MVVFDHAQRAALCAVEMQIGIHELRQRHREAGMPDIHVGIGIASGKVMAGLIGSDAYRTFTVMGEVVNLAARIEAFSLRGQVLMSETTYRQCADFVRVGEPMSVYVKGQADGVPIRELLAIPELGKTVPRQDLRKSPRVEINVDLEYWAVAGKVVDGRPLRGMVRNIGYHGVLAAVAEPPPLYSELRLAFELPRLGFRAADVYARVVSVRAQSGDYLAGLEFTSLGAEANTKIPLFVQMNMQAEVSE